MLCIKAMHNLGRKTIENYDDKFAKKKRFQNIVDLKCICVVYMLESFDITFTKVCGMIGLTNHTTIIHYKNKYECQKRYPDFQHLIVTYLSEVNALIKEKENNEEQMPLTRDELTVKQKIKLLRNAIEIGQFNPHKLKKL